MNFKEIQMKYVFVYIILRMYVSHLIAKFKHNSFFIIKVTWVFCLHWFS